MDSVSLLPLTGRLTLSLNLFLYNFTSLFNIKSPYVPWSNDVCGCNYPSLDTRVRVIIQDPRFTLTKEGLWITQYKYLLLRPDLKLPLHKFPSETLELRKLTTKPRTIFPRSSPEPPVECFSIVNNLRWTDKIRLTCWQMKRQKEYEPNSALQPLYIDCISHPCLR